MFRAVSLSAMDIGVVLSVLHLGLEHLDLGVAVFGSPIVAIVVYLVFQLQLGVFVIQQPLAFVYWVEDLFLFSLLWRFNQRAGLWSLEQVQLLLRIDYLVLLLVVLWVLMVFVC
ncbi:hypothetical protein U1Q18_025684 [Sarracenia purpurea var. burkii]